MELTKETQSALIKQLEKCESTEEMLQTIDLWIEILNTPVEELSF